MLQLDLLKNEIDKLGDPEIDFEGLVNYLRSAQEIDQAVLKFFESGSKSYRSNKEHVRQLYSFLMMCRHESFLVDPEYFIHLLPFIFYTEHLTDNKDAVGGLRQNGLDFTDFLRVTGGVSSHHGLLHPFPRNSLGFYNLKSLFDKLIDLYETYGVSVKNILNYAYSQSSSTASAVIFNHWYEYVTNIRPSDNLDLMPENFLFEYNELRAKQGREKLVYDLKKYSGGNFELMRRGRTVVLIAALPWNSKTNQVDFNQVKIWFDQVEIISIMHLKNSVVDTRIGNKYGDLFFEVDIRLNPNSLIMVNEDEFDPISVFHKDTSDNSLMNQHSFGTTWIPFYEGPSRIDLRKDALIAFRKKTTYTQKDAAKAVNAKVRTFQNWEAGNSSPSIEALIRMLSLYDVTSFNSFIVPKRYFDEDDEAFKSGKLLSEIFPMHYNALEEDEEEGGE